MSIRVRSAVAVCLLGASFSALPGCCAVYEAFCDDTTAIVASNNPGAQVTPPAQVPGHDGGDEPDVITAVDFGFGGGVLFDIEIKKVGGGVPLEAWVWAGTWNVLGEVPAAPPTVVPSHTEGLQNTAKNHVSTLVRFNRSQQKIWLFVRVRYNEGAGDLFKNYVRSWDSRDPDLHPTDSATWVNRTKPFRIQPTLTLDKLP